MSSSGLPGHCMHTVHLTHAKNLQLGRKCLQTGFLIKNFYLEYVKITAGHGGNTFKPSTWEAEAGRSGLRVVWSTE